MSRILKNYINGKWVDAKAGKRLDVEMACGIPYLGRGYKIFTVIGYQVSGGESC